MTVPNFRPFSHLKVPVKESATTATWTPVNGNAGTAPTRAHRLGDDENCEAVRAEEEETDEEKKKREDEEAAKAKKAKHAQKDEGETSSDREVEEDEKASAIAGERQRIKAIIAAAEPKPNPRLRAALRVISLGLSVEESLEWLPDADLSEKSVSLREKMATVQVPAIGSDAIGGTPTLAEQIILAGKKRRGEL